MVACAASAGVHAGLVPEHLREEPRLGVAFLAAVVLLLTVVASETIRPADARVAGAAAVLLAGLIAAYAVTRSTGIPLLAPDPEPVDLVGVGANVVEALGLGSALYLAHALHTQTRSNQREVAP